MEIGNLSNADKLISSDGSRLKYFHYPDDITINMNNYLNTPLIDLAYYIGTGDIISLKVHGYKDNGYRFFIPEENANAPQTLPIKVYESSNTKNNIIIVWDASSHYYTDTNYSDEYVNRFSIDVLYKS